MRPCLPTWLAPPKNSSSYQVTRAWENNFQHFPCRYRVPVVSPLSACGTIPNGACFPPPGRCRFVCVRAWNGYAHSIRVKGGGGECWAVSSCRRSDRAKPYSGRTRGECDYATNEREMEFPAILFLLFWIGAVVRFSIPRGRPGECSIFFRMKERGGREKVQPSTVDGFAEVDTLFRKASAGCVFPPGRLLSQVRLSLGAVWGCSHVPFVWT